MRFFSFLVSFVFALSSHADGPYPQPGGGSATNVTYGAVIGAPVVYTLTNTDGSVIITNTSGLSTNSGVVSGTLNLSANPPAGVVTNQFNYPGVIAIFHTNGAPTYYYPLTNSDAGFGTNLSVAFSNAVSGDMVYVGPGSYLAHIMSNPLTNNVTYQFNGGRIYIDSSSGSARGAPYQNWLFYSDQPQEINWKFLGPITLDGMNVANNDSAIVCQGGMNRLIRDVTFQQWSQYGLYSAGGNGPGNSIQTCLATNNATGFFIQGDYWQSLLDVAQSNNVGFWCGGGNNVFTDCSGQNNGAGLVLDGLSNPGHGDWVGGDLNHNVTNLFITPTFVQGFTFVGAHVYAGNVQFDGQGCTFNGGDWASTMFAGTNLSGIVDFDGVVFPQSQITNYTSNLSSGQLATNLYFTGCHTLTNWSGVNNSYYGTFTGNGGGLTNLNAANMAGVVTNNYGTLTVSALVAGANGIGLNYGVGNQVLLASNAIIAFANTAGINVNTDTGTSLTRTSPGNFFFRTNITSVGSITANSGITTTISNAVPVWGTTSIATSVNTYATNNFSTNADAFIYFAGTTITGVGLCGTNAGAAGSFNNVSTALTGGMIHVRYGNTVVFTNGITAGNYNWTY